MLGAGLASGFAQGQPLGPALPPATRSAFFGAVALIVVFAGLAFEVRASERSLLAVWFGWARWRWWCALKFALTFGLSLPAPIPM